MVQILEDLNVQKFAEQFGWNADVSLTKKNSVGANAKTGLREKLEAYGLWDRLRKANEHDSRLYEYARAKFTNLGNVSPRVSETTVEEGLQAASESRRNGAHA
jgi:hypothetical protein